MSKVYRYVSKYTIYHPETRAILVMVGQQLTPRIIKALRAEGVDNVPCILKIAQNWTKQNVRHYFALRKAGYTPTKAWLYASKPSLVRILFGA